MGSGSSRLEVTPPRRWKRLSVTSFLCGGAAAAAAAGEGGDTCSSDSTEVQNPQPERITNNETNLDKSETVNSHPSSSDESNIDPLQSGTSMSESQPGQHGETNNDRARSNNVDDVRFYDRWLEIGDELFGDGAGYTSHRRHGSSGLSFYSRSMRRERGRADRARNNNNYSNSLLCPSGVHSDGTCLCRAFSLAEQAEASISRIVMLTEALFEYIQVLDEMHHEPASLCVHAPESVINSLPSKTHIKPDTARSADDVDQCYICLTEYENGDQIRVLPCNHEFHMSCVDKWLKEIHRVCPLCRGDVCEGTS